jgi:hypothetical protein
MKLGAEPKKVAMLVGILGVGLAVMFLGDDGPPARTGPSTAPRVQVPPAAGPRTVPVAAQREDTRTRPALRAAVQEFKPVLKSARAEDRVDPATIDPTLRLELIKRLAAVQIEGGSRTIFDFGAAPPPKQPDPPKIFPKPPTAATPAPPPPPPVSLTPAAPVKPAAPPIRLKFYGFVGGARTKTKRAFFLDGEDIFVAGEGDVIQKRYRVVRIGLNSVVMEDLEFKSEQTLTLEEQQG